MSVELIAQLLYFLVAGDRFYSFLHHFSLYVLTKVMSRDHGKFAVYNIVFHINLTMWIFVENKIIKWH